MTVRFDSILPDVLNPSQLHTIFTTLDLLLSAQMLGIRKKALNIVLSILVLNGKNLDEYKEIYKILSFSKLVRWASPR